MQNAKWFREGVMGIMGIMGIMGNERLERLENLGSVGSVGNLGSVGKISLNSLNSLNSQAILLTSLTLTTLIATSTPASYGGNSKPDPPPSPRLGGGCVPRLCLGRNCGHYRWWVSEIADTTDY